MELFEKDFASTTNMLVSSRFRESWQFWKKYGDLTIQGLESVIGCKWWLPKGFKHCMDSQYYTGDSKIFPVSSRIAMKSKSE